MNGPMLRIVYELNETTDSRPTHAEQTSEAFALRPSGRLRCPRARSHGNFHVSQQPSAPIA